MHGDLSRLLRSHETTASLHIDVSHDSLRQESAAEIIRRDVVKSLHAAGASDSLVATLLESVRQIPGSIDPIGVAVVATEEIVIRQPTPGDAPAQPAVTVGAVPDLRPLLRARERALPVLVVEARASGGEIMTFPAPGMKAVLESVVEGDPVEVAEAHTGGIAAAAHSGSAEDALVKNARRLADRVAATVRASGPRAILVTGDPRTAATLTDELPDVEGVHVDRWPKDSIAAGAAGADLSEGVRSFVEHLLAHEHALTVEQLTARSYRLGAVDVSAVVDALRAAAVDTLLVGPSGIPGEVLALAAEPWLAWEDGDALGVAAVGRVPAESAIIRAAVLTGARIVFPSDGVIPDDASVAALLRRPIDA